MTSDHSAADIDRHVRVYITVFVALMALTLVTVTISYLHLPLPIAVTVALLVATVKRSMVARYCWIRRDFTPVAAVMIGVGSSVLACPVCCGAEETSMIDGARLGVLVMLAILFVVQGGFVGFFLYLRKRAKRIADAELDTEWS